MREGIDKTVLSLSPQVKLVCTAAVPPEELFRARLQHSRDEQASRVLLDDLEIAEVCAYTESTQ